MNTCKFFAYTAVLFLFLNCTKNNESASSKDLRVEVNTNTLYADGLDELVITVFDSDNNNVTSNSDVFINNVKVAGNVHKLNDLRDYTIKAILNNKESNTAKVKVIRHEVNNFTRKTVLEEFAGTWCSFCTLFTYRIDSIVKGNPGFIPVSIHSGDAMEYMFSQQMRNKFNLSGFPIAYLNRNNVWNETPAAITTELSKKSKCGLAISSVVNGNDITATVKVKFDITTSESLDIVVLLLEDKLVYSQANFYNNNPSSPFFNLGDPILNYQHNNVLRKAATDIFGNLLPVASQTKNNTWEKKYTFNASGYAISNCKIVAFVKYTQNNVSRWGVLNAQTVKAGSSILFD
jgi:hypothetical protein